MPLLSRRRLVTAAAAPLMASRCVAADAPLISAVEKRVLRRGEEGTVWFHPRACRAGDRVVMTLQAIRGSDYFGPLHFTVSEDAGRTWSDFLPVPSLGWEPAADGWNEAVCDVTPQYHPSTRTVIALGHNVFYRGEKFDRRQPPRRPIYAVWKDGKWGPRRALVWDDPRAGHIYSNNCGQRVVLPNGDVLMSFTFGPREGPRAVCGVLCEYRSEQLTLKRTGPPLTHPVGRGLLEPSLVRYRGRYYLTMRAEDGRGYVAAGDDGLTYGEKQPWCWDDGSPLEMSTTQQHWLDHGEALYLVYTRRDPSNEKLFRWRAPLWMAQVDPTRLRLMRETERVVLPVVGDAARDPRGVPLNGNFGVAHISPRESWITDGSWCPAVPNRGELAVARVLWSRPNPLA